MPKSICPACVHRSGGFVAPSCPVCAGAGVVSLSPVAVASFGGDVVAQAVTITLEATARVVDVPGITRSVRREAIVGAVQELARRGITERGRTLRVSVTARAPQQIAMEVTGAPVIPSDWTLPDAAPYRYQATDRPYGRGLPLLSRTGHPSHLARIVDPADPLGPGNAAEVHARTRAEREATNIARVVTGGTKP